MSRVTVLSVPIDRLTRDEADDALRRMIAEDAFHHVATPNNEMLVEAMKNQAFRSVLQRTALNLPDSTGVLWASRREGLPIPERVPGVDVVTRLCAGLGSEHPVFFLGAADGVAEKAAHALHVRNPHLTIAGTYGGSPSDADAPAIIRRIVSAGTHVLFVAYGAPWQDLWIDRHRSQLTGVRLAMGVGGTFDFIAGVRKRAPVLVQSLGLEWLWRLVQEPSRIGRIWKAVVVFSLLVLRQRSPITSRGPSPDASDP